MKYIYTKNEFVNFSKDFVNVNEMKNKNKCLDEFHGCFELF